MDRVITTPDAVHVIDFKTGAHENNPLMAAYQKQMQIYKAAMAQLYPNHTIKGALLWVDEGVLHPI